MKKYTIIAGVNGVGKSSFTGVLAELLNDLGRIIDTDSITAKLEGNKLLGGKEAVRAISSCIDKGISFTQETTLSGTRTIKTIKKAIEKDYYIRLYYIGVSSAEESIKRIKNRVEKGGHDISSEDVRRRYAKRFDDLAAVLPYCSEVHFYDNENGFVEKAEYRNGGLIIRSDGIPLWLEELRKSFERNGL
ncbi:MAG: zeta toxin family protein [Oscillospiraceae bacterium]|nr:zeta toxin family protein [Oscillospiraceae bacterium]